MVKKSAKEPVIKSIIRGVVREELDQALQKQKVELKEELLEAFDQKIDATFTRYRDETLASIDKLVKDYRGHEEDHILNQGRHDDFEERITTIEKIHPNSQHSFA